MDGLRGRRGQWGTEEKEVSREKPSTLDGKRKIIKQELNSLSQKKSNPAVPWFQKKTEGEKQVCKYIINECEKLKPSCWKGSKKVFIHM